MAEAVVGSIVQLWDQLYSCGINCTAFSIDLAKRPGVNSHIEILNATDSIFKLTFRVCYVNEKHLSEGSLLV